MTLADRYDVELPEFALRLQAVPVATAALPYRAGGWTRKETLGHLIDSAINNHVRFAGAATNPSLSMLFGYEQNGWVDVHGYRDMEWAELVAHWRMQNEPLARVIPHLPLTQVLRAGDTTWTLAEWASDYLVHLRHHVDQITA